GGALMVSAILPIAYSKEFASIFVRDPVTLQNVTIAFAVLGFVVLDFSINAVMTASRALIVDSVPLKQQNFAFVWASRMSGFGNMLGYFTGFANLVSAFQGIADRHPVLFGSQLKILCAICNACLVASLGLTVSSVRDLPAPPPTVAELPSAGGGPRRATVAALRQCLGPLVVIFRALRRLPAPLQNICNVQFFGWLGWFPFLFYASSWVGSRVPVPADGEGDRTTAAARAGALALLLNSALSLAATVAIPDALVRFAGPHSPAQKRILAGAPKWTRRLLTVPGVWAASLLLFAGLLVSTAARPGLVGATIVVVLVGVPWGVTQWVPFSLVAEYVAFHASSGDTDASAGSDHGRPGDYIPVRPDDDDLDLDDPLDTVVNGAASTGGGLAVGSAPEPP
ncbi:hypothetical protein HK405_012036, partial [Cladochytrium tenue]